MFTDAVSDKFEYPHSIQGATLVWLDHANSFFSHAIGTFPLAFSQYGNAGGTDAITTFVNLTNIKFFCANSWGSAWTKYITLRYIK